ncbi:MAG: hypothetical protein M3364_08140 [Actinomycetota bacterium]|nr:hypothetical protein [Actinomycetota bacterium]
MWETIADEAARESPLWADSLKAADERRPEPVFSSLVSEELALGVETIYEGYLVHYGKSQLFSPPNADTALLLGDSLYAQGLVHIAATGNVDAVADLAELISLCSQARAEGRNGDGAAWAATAARLGAGGLDDAREALRMDADPSGLDDAARASAGNESVDRALAAHALLIG